MGIKNINKLLKPICKEGIFKENLSNFSKKYIAIDISIFLYKYSCNNKKTLLEHLLFQLAHLLKLGITPLYLFDGKPSDYKMKLIAERREIFKKKKTEIDDLATRIETLMAADKLEEADELIQEKIKKEKTYTKINYDDVRTFKQILKLAGIFYYKCPGETDVFIKKFFDAGIIEYAITEDLDFLTHGCQNVIFGYTYKDDNVVVYNLKKILEELQLNQEQFIDMSLMLGCDYMVKMDKVGPMTGHKLIKTHGNIETVIEKTKYNFIEECDYQTVRTLFTGEHESEQHEITDTKNTTQIKYRDYVKNKKEINSLINNKRISNMLSSYLTVKKQKTKNIMTFIKK